MKITRDELFAFVSERGACRAAMEWIKKQAEDADFEAIWEACQNEAWLAWLLGKTGHSLCPHGHADCDSYDPDKYSSPDAIRAAFSASVVLDWLAPKMFPNGKREENG